MEATAYLVCEMYARKRGHAGIDLQLSERPPAALRATMKEAGYFWLAAPFVYRAPETDAAIKVAHDLNAFKNGEGY